MNKNWYTFIIIWTIKMNNKVHIIIETIDYNKNNRKKILMKLGYNSSKLI